MAIENRDLEVGTKLIVVYKKEEYRAEVIAGEEGKVRYRLADGRVFKSPSSAATAITGKAANGWNFWSVEPARVETEPEGGGSEATGPTEQSSAVGFGGSPTRRA